VVVCRETFPSSAYQLESPTPTRAPSANAFCHFPRLEPPVARAALSNATTAVAGGRAGGARIHGLRGNGWLGWHPEIGPTHRRPRSATRVDRTYSPATSECHPGRSDLLAGDLEVPPGQIGPTRRRPRSAKKYICNSVLATSPNLWGIAQLWRPRRHLVRSPDHGRPRLQSLRPSAIASCTLRVCEKTSLSARRHRACVERIQDRHLVGSAPSLSPWFGQIDERGGRDIAQPLASGSSATPRRGVRPSDAPSERRRRRHCLRRYSRTCVDTTSSTWPAHSR